MGFLLCRVIGRSLGQFNISNYSYNWEEPWLYLCIFALFAVQGGGRLSLDALREEEQ